MGKAISYDHREKIVQRKKQGQDDYQIAKDLGVSQGVVRKILKLYQIKGIAAFETNYSNCGKTSCYGEEVRKAVKKIRDNRQGAAYVRSKLLQHYPHLDAPSERTLTRWWKKEKTNRSKGRPVEREKKVESTSS